MTLWALLILFITSGSGGTEHSSAPFWRAKEKLYQRISEQHEIIISVSSSRLENGLHANRTSMSGGGQVNAPLECTFQHSLEFSQLPRITDYVQTADYNKANGKLQLSLKAYGHQLNVELNIATRESEGRKFLDFTVTSGPLSGLMGTVDFRAVNGKKTETGYAATFDYDVLPIPKLFLEFGLEVVIQRMAFRTRQAIEGDCNVR